MSNTKLSPPPSRPKGLVFMKRSAGFYDYAWDIVVGCKNGCEYCYARRVIEHRPGRKFDDIRFYFDMIREPYYVDPCKIFVNHYADIMGDWVPADWINKIIGTCKELPHHIFFWMTKNPKRYHDFRFPDNCILGVTIESPKEWWRAEEILRIGNRKMASVEPILGDFTGYNFSQFELVVVGGLLTFNDKPRSTEFYDTVKHNNIWFQK